MSDSDVSLVRVEQEGQRQYARQPRQSDHTERSYASEDSEAYTRLNIPVFAANSWQDVDRDQLSQTVLKLISSVASTAPTDDKSRDAVWHPTTTLTVTQNLNDPLGFGRIDIVNLRLEPHDSPNEHLHGWQAGAPSSAAAMEAAATARQESSKGAVGRFFSELTRPAGQQAQQAAGGGGTGHGSRSRRDKPSAAGPGPPVPASKLLPGEEGFDPAAYLAVFHASASAAELAAGLRALERELGERTGQLQQLVKQNFDRFISCKTTIDDIHDKLQRIESTKGSSTEVLYNAIQEVQAGARTVFGPILDRSAKVERIRSVQQLLRRFSGLFSMPQRIRALAAARDFEQVVAEFKKANNLIKPGPSTLPVWVRLYTEIEKRVDEVYQQLQWEVQDPLLPAAAASELVMFMLQLQAEGLAFAAGANPLALLLAAREAQFAAAMAGVAADQERALGRLRAAMAATAADEKLRDPAAISEALLLKWTGIWEGSSGRAAAASAGSPTSSPTAAAAASRSFYSSSSSSSTPVFDRVLSGYRSAAAAVVADGSDDRPAAAGATAAAALFGVAGGSGAAAGGGHSRHLAELAPLSGLQPPAPRSRLVQDTAVTAGEELYLRHLQRQSAVLLECLPGFWQAAGTGGTSSGSSSKLTLPPNLPAAAAAQLQKTLAGAADITGRLVRSYCQGVKGLLAALAAVGPLRESLLVAVEDLAGTLAELESHKAPITAVLALKSVLVGAAAAGVQQLVAALQAVPAALVGRETWQLSLTHAGSQPITLLPEQLQEEVTVVLQYYQQLLGATTGNSSSSSICSATAGATLMSHERSTKPIRDAFFSCLEETVKSCKAAAELIQPSAAAVSAGPAAAALSGSSSSSRSSSSRSKRPASLSTVAETAVLGTGSLSDGSDEEDQGAYSTLGLAAAAAAVGSSSSSGVLHVALSNDVKLLLIGSNLNFMRTKLVGSLTQRFLLVLTGEVAAELDRCSRYAVKLAGQLDAAVQAVHGLYQERKWRAIDRLLAGYVMPDGEPVGRPAELRGVSHHAQQLVALVTSVQAETYTYARPYMQQLLHAVLEYLGSALASAFAALPAAAAQGTAASGAAAGAGCPVEALAQYFIDLVYLDAVLSKAGPNSLSVDLTAAYTLLASRICSPGSSSSSRDKAETPLARSLLAIKDPQELSRKLQVTCRKALREVLEHCSFTVRGLLAPATGGGASTGGGAAP